VSGQAKGGGCGQDRGRRLNEQQRTLWDDRFCASVTSCRPFCPTT